jgi:hypothetical protein
VKVVKSDENDKKWWRLLVEEVTQEDTLLGVHQ